MFQDQSLLFEKSTLRHSGVLLLQPDTWQCSAKAQGALLKGALAI